MGRLLGLFLALASIAGGWAYAEPAAIRDCSRAEVSGERVLCQEAPISASPEALWTLFSTNEGLQSWVAPVAAIDLRVGGVFESSYDLSSRIGDAGNIRNRIIEFRPNQVLIFQVAEAPPGFPHVEQVRQLTTVIELTPINDDVTRARVSMLGYRAGEGFDFLYQHFARGNAYTLTKLDERVRLGPVDWSGAEVAAATETMQ